MNKTRRLKLVLALITSYRASIEPCKGFHVKDSLQSTIEVYTTVVITAEHCRGNL